MSNLATDSFGEWACAQHAATNHYYDKELNNTYAFHLKMAVLVGEEFKYLLPTNSAVMEKNKDTWECIVKPAIWGHDLIEDARQSYSDIFTHSNKQVAEICRAVTNYGRGRNRDERMPDWLYKEIVDTPFAVFVKLCDRIANVRYSIMMRSRMLEVYAKEQEHFKKMLRHDLTLEPMWILLDELLATKLNKS